MWLTLLLAACGQRGDEAPIVVTIYKVSENKSVMGCIGTDWNTYVRTDDNRVSMVCGDWGTPGTKLKGIWITGATGEYAEENGFKIR